ncbi:MAG: hypothetical protein FJ096_16875 [Deltaproteobacteria bacterium]|nr:hypothetical protein [Deltaproteobacteria bacterium]
MRQGSLLLLSLGLAAAVASACSAELETTCVGGICEPLPPSSVASSSEAASTSTGGGSGGAGGGAPVCFAACDVTQATTRTGKYPCAIEKVLADNCRRCHTTPTTGGAPFSLDAYEDSQALYAGKVIFSRIKGAVESKFMPLSPPTLSDEEIEAFTEWTCACAPPRAASETCD